MVGKKRYERVLRLFCGGVKVAAEVTCMATDAGLVEPHTGGEWRRTHGLNYGGKEMQILILSGSRNPAGQTARAAAALAAGADEAGAHCETVFLPMCRIERCRQCEDNGWGLCRDSGGCIIADDLPELTDRLAAADAVVFATPVYYSDLSESLRAFLDRLRRTATHPDGREKTADKRAVGLCVAGGGGGGAPACCVSLEKVLRTSGFDVVDLIPVRRQNLEAKLPQLHALGGWLATTG